MRLTPSWAIAPRRQTVDALAAQADLAAGQRQQAGEQVEQGRLAGAVGADQRGDLAAVHGQAHVVVGHQPAEALDQAFRVQQRLVRRQRHAARQRLRYDRHLQRRGRTPALRQARREQRPQAVAGVLQAEDDQRAEDDGLEVASLAEQLRQQVLQPLLEHGDQGRADQRAAQAGGAAEDDHEQVLDADGRPRMASD